MSEHILLGSTSPDKEVTYDTYRKMVIAQLSDILDGCSSETDVLNLIGDLALLLPVQLRVHMYGLGPLRQEHGEEAHRGELREMMSLNEIALALTAYLCITLFEPRN